MDARFALERARVSRGLYFGSAPHTEGKADVSGLLGYGVVPARTLCSAADFLAHHLPLFALSLVLFGLVMLDCGPFIMTGEPGE
jgi:hypothetical protein